LKRGRVRKTHYTRGEGSRAHSIGGRVRKTHSTIGKGSRALSKGSRLWWDTNLLKMKAMHYDQDACILYLRNIGSSSTL